jgi:hypothetical protein
VQTHIDIIDGLENYEEIVSSLGFHRAVFHIWILCFTIYLTGYPHPWGLTPEPFSLGIITPPKKKQKSGRQMFP